MARILLIQPSFSKGSETPYPPAMPLGLIYIGTYLKAHGHEVKILDRNLEPSDEHLLELLKEGGGYDFIGIGTFTGKMLFDAMDISKLIKANSSAIIVWGSFHPTIVPEDTLKNDYIDYIIRGEGEETFLKMVELYEQDKTEEISKLNGVNLNPPAIPPNLDSLPFPDYDLIDVDAYDTFFILTSRGCPFFCHFCYNSYGNKCVKPYRDLSADKAIELIKTLTKKYNKKTFCICDDNFPSNRQRLKIISEALAAENYKFYTFCRANYCDIETLTLLKKAGCWTVQIGIESGSDRILKFLNKATTVKMNTEAIQNCKKVGILADASVMIGIPTETTEEIEQTIDFIKRTKPDSGGVSIFHPYPQTKLWDYCLDNKLLEVPKTTEEWAKKYAMNDADLNVSSHSGDALMKYFAEINQLLNPKKRYFKKLFLYIKNGRLPSMKRIVNVIKSKLKLNRFLKKGIKKGHKEKTELMEGRNAS